MSKSTSCRKITVVLGNACNFRCKHCSDDSTIRLNISKSEIPGLSKELDRNNISKITFVGGETCFYVKEINKILNPLTDLDRKTIKITTNGYFASTPESALKKINSFKKIDGIQLSYDIFHKNFLPFKNIKNLHGACKKLKKDFSVILTISSPLDLLLIKKLRTVGEFKIGLQKVLPRGRAVKNKVFFNPINFSKQVLTKKCPGRKEIIYMCQKGYTICCSNLFDKFPEEIIYKKSINELKNSSFHSLLTRNTFGELLKKFNLLLKKPPALFSIECNLCQFIFKSIKPYELNF